jgi:hypothetical protein
MVNKYIFIRTNGPEQALEPHRLSLQNLNFVDCANPRRSYSGTGEQDRLALRIVDPSSFNQPFFYLNR